MKRSPMKRTAWPFPSALHDEEKEAAKEARARSLAASAKAAPRSTSVMRAATSIKPAPKKPADRNMMYRALAEGEDCTVLLPGGACDPRTVVLAHTNTQADEKGMGYKGHDSAGFFACHRCHAVIDQPSGKAALDEEERRRCIAQAQARTAARLTDISNSPTMKAWKVKAARWALERKS